MRVSISYLSYFRQPATSLFVFKRVLRLLHRLGQFGSVSLANKHHRVLPWLVIDSHQDDPAKGAQPGTPSEVLSARSVVRFSLISDTLVKNSNLTFPIFLLLLSPDPGTPREFDLCTCHITSDLHPTRPHVQALALAHATTFPRSCHPTGPLGATNVDTTAIAFPLKYGASA